MILINVIARLMTKNRSAGNDLINLSPTFRCMLIEPKSRTANPILPVKVRASNWIDANKIIANVTFRNPMK